MYIHQFGKQRKVIGNGTVVHATNVERSANIVPLQKDIEYKKIPALCQDLNLLSLQKTSAYFVAPLDEAFDVVFEADAVFLVAAFFVEAVVAFLALAFFTGIAFLVAVAAFDVPAAFLGAAVFFVAVAADVFGAAFFAVAALEVAAFFAVAMFVQFSG
ncbi:hypothetical protein FC093_04080 [Ilyomonas limi]|uniref:Uncharacterized protein n=1 Tax=Ilyomonas limi TaxID=2575867 RepID=A0A4U3L755_9BACT|nr:hypothetical protein [Ilyomonas limi]TKK70880.1 hypothetical protein FC093_04080 [Ilyomonas limi]